MSTKRKTPPRRAADKTTLTIALPKELKSRIEAAAQQDQRSTSNSLVKELASLLGVKLSLLAFAAFHLVNSPTDWHAEALAASFSKAVALIASLS